VGQPYRCPVCGHVIFTGEGLTSGQIKLPCTNRECPTRRGGRPIQQQKFTFGSGGKK
jgi:hypothetical protein